MIERPRHLAAVSRLLDEFPVVALIGARQVGKTTLARTLAERRAGPGHHFDLEDPRTQARLAAPMLALEGLAGLVVLDEVQLRPELFPILRVLADRPGTPARFLILGSASPELMQRSAESLAGRIAYHELPGLDLTETGATRMEALWLRGGFPKSLLAATDPASVRWRREFIRSYLERDIPALGVRLPPATPRSAPHGKATPCTRWSVASASTGTPATTGSCIPGPNSISSSRPATGASASNSSSAIRRASRRPCDRQ